MATVLYKVAWEVALWNGQLCVCTQHWKGDDADDTPNSLLSALQTNLETPFVAMLTSDDTLVRTTAIQVPTGSTPPAEPQQGHNNRNVTGTRGSTTHDAESAITAVASLYTGFAGRTRRGRFWLPPPGDASSMQSPSRFNAGTTAWFGKGTAFMDAWMSHLTMGSLVAIVYSKKDAARDVESWKPILSYVLKNRQHWLESRASYSE